MDKIRVGIIGCGEIANGVHITGLLACSDAVITALCDIDSGALESTGKRLGLQADARYVEYEALLRSQNVDAVCICTPNHAHFPIAMETIRLGIPFALEKPMTLNEAQAEDLYNATRQTGVSHMICFSYRFKAAARYAKKLIEDGALGELYHVHAQYMQSWADKSQPYYWRFSKEISGSGTLGDLGCHIIDLARFITGCEFISVNAQSGIICHKRKALHSDEMMTVDVDDWVNFLSRMSNGLTGVFMSSRFASGRGNYQTLEVFGEKGSLVYHFDNEKDWLEVCVGDVYKSTNTFTELPIDYYKGNQMRSFLEIVKGTADKYSANVKDGYVCQRVCDAVMRSAEIGCEVKL